MNEHLNEIQLAQCIDLLREGKIPDPEASAHLESCFQCRAVILDVLNVWPKTLQAKRSNAKNLKIYWTVAAALIPLIILSSIWLFNPAPAVEPTAEISSKDEISRSPEITSDKKSDEEIQAHPKPPEASLFAADFERNPTLDNFVGSNVRGASVEVESPKIDAEQHRKVFFRWKFSFPLTLVILDNRGTVISKELIENSSVDIQGLKPGLYYWKLENEDEALFIGRFIMK